MDKRILEHAKILVDYSVKTKPGDNVLIKYADSGLELAKAVYDIASERGAYSLIQQVPSSCLRSLLDRMPADQLKTTPRLDDALWHSIDSIISIRGDENLEALNGVESSKLSSRAFAMQPINEYVHKKKWVITQAPNPAYAQEAGMSLDEYENFLYGSIIRNWGETKKDAVKIETLLNGTDNITIEGKDTNLTFSIKNRKAISGIGEHNMPDGEVYTSILEDSVNGKVCFDIPTKMHGKDVKEIMLKFSNGEVVDYKAAIGEDVLRSVIESEDSSNKGSRRLGEFGIGINYGITKPTNNILFDEKMGGTIHLAVGHSYEECLGKNKSSIHWDLIKNMKDGTIKFDEKNVYRNGQFVV